MLNFMVRPFLEEFTEIIAVEIIGKCPYCGHSMTFFYYAPKQCGNCDYILPDLGSVLSTDEGRLEYHKYGTTTDKFGVLEDFVGGVKGEFYRSKAESSN